MVLNTIRASRSPFAVPDVEDRRASVRRGIRALLDADMRPDDLRMLLNAALWRYTEFDQRYKFAIRYRSRAVLERDGVTIQHEHVVTRQWLRDRIMAHPDRLDAYLELAVACVVTKDEHDSLPSDAFGWQRYIAAGIDVVDTVDMSPLDLSRAAEDQAQKLRALGEPPTLQVEEAPDDTGLDRVLQLTAHRRDSRRHLDVFEALIRAGYFIPEHGGAGYVSFHDPASGRNFLNLTPTLAWIMRASLRTELAHIEGVDVTGRHPKITLDDEGAIELIERLANRYKE